MVLLRDYVHPRGLLLAQQRKVYIRRTVHKESWVKIAPQIKNREGGVPGWAVCRDTFKRMFKDGAQSGYENCGRRAVITPVLQKWLVKRLLALRVKTVCTSGMLQRELARKKGLLVEASTVRRHLGIAGYAWLRRGKKRLYTPEQKSERKAFTTKVAAMSDEKLKAEFDFSMDGVVLTIPPKEIVARQNFLRTDDQFIWRKPSERMLPELAGHDPYSKQVPKDRMLPLWGGISWGGFGLVLQHQDRKTDAEEWARAVRAGRLEKALRTANPGKRCGPWKILCDNETFSRAPDSKKAYRECNVSLLKLPPKSPDLNPVEKYWSWVRRRMRAMDLADLAAKRPPLGKVAFKARLMRLLRTQKAKAVAANTMRNLKKTFAEVVLNGGGASSG